MPTLQIIGSILLACVPAYIWGYIYYKKNPEDRRLTALTFTVGALAVFPILIYKYLWQYFPWINAFNFANSYRDDLIGLTTSLYLPLSVIITFMLVGVIEEIMKLFAAKVVDDNEYRTVDDSIEFFILAALGFSFTENILYFYNIWVTQGASNLFLPFLFRSTFSTFAHLLFSGLLGYYHGMAHFAKPILQEQIRLNQYHWVVILHKISRLKKTTIFKDEKMFEGALLAIGLHAIFNILLELGLTYLIVPFLIAGYISLEYLFELKENRKIYGLLAGRAQKRGISGKQKTLPLA